MSRAESDTYAERELCSDEAFEFASRYLVAGMTTPGRRREELDGRPFFVSRGSGAYLFDLDGRRYVDLNCGHGAALVGHSHPAIKAALHKGIERGIMCGQGDRVPQPRGATACGDAPLCRARATHVHGYGGHGTGCKGSSGVYGETQGRQV